MSRYRKGALYIRRLKSSDKSSSWQTACQMACHQLMMEEGKQQKAYVLVRHGSKGDVMTIARSRKELQDMLLWSGKKHRNFKSMCRSWRRKPEEQAHG